MSQKQYAKEHSLDIPHIACIEFPMKVKNVEKAFEMVGGKESISKSCLDEEANPLELRLTNDIYHHPIGSKVNHNEQVLVKISIPKKEYLANDRNIQKTIKELQNDHKKPVHVTPVAIINKTFRFRGLSDFQYQTANSKFVQKINDSIHSLNYENIKNLQFKQDSEPWEYEDVENELFDLPPVPRFSSIPLPFQYNYKKNAATIVKEGKITVKNKHIKLHSIIIKWNDEVPQGPSADLINQLEIFEKNSDVNPFFKDILTVIGIVKKLFEIKPIWIRKHLDALLPVHLKPNLKYALPQLAYTYSKGPWRQSYIKYGIDPKSSNIYAKYQTESFRVPNFSKKIDKGFVSEVPNGVSNVFIFNGEDLPMSLSFQIENLQDIQVTELLNKSTFREECDFNDGWYDSLTMLKLRRLMRYKLKHLVDGTRTDETKIHHILNNTTIQEKEDDMEAEDGDDNEEAEDVDDEDENDDDIDDEEFDAILASYKDILAQLHKNNPQGADQLEKLAGLIKQNNLNI